MNRTCRESIDELSPIAARVKEDGLITRLSIPMTFGCPFEGNPGIDRILELIDIMAQKEFTRIGLCDTIGIANPQQVFDWVSRIHQAFSALEFELHFHNTYGRGLVNVMAGMEAGVSRFDICVGGLGGCPFAPGTTGNVATEDLVSILQESGVETGINLGGVLAASDFLHQTLVMRINSNV
ncbi:MAG: hypothetical protein H7240_03165 [Glaciimonas sp.]|nr:hypothetical protein [Glaciimonas sp.]